MSIEIKLADIACLAPIAELEAEAFREPWSESALELFLANDNFAFAAFENDALVSYCTVTTVLDEAQVINVATSKAHRGRGYAEKVLCAVIAECHTRGIASISLEVRESNEHAVSLYKKLGFEVAGKRRDFYRVPREDALVMIKILK